ncbi:carbamoyltransferase C-terminal domain-containing protein [Roseateles depolymerans]|uniref:Carbamoyltransferase n=1 Tax=Roseateles depolymerans TaxID=76731 RepID=A0A0U3D1C7_9BURK|nr:carbamoyltransferase C-terminal domain-containing protein [Roseateles depolymerans]ALV07414.1 Carbamoyltransferase [Roseateles depolymerans]REG22372.1 carbamoyltransferase [Roseateles depolymerans]
MSKKRSISLGIHVGHDSACAVAIDGCIVSALQQERVTRRKHDGQASLSERLPIREVLNAAGVTIDDVDRIVSSHQSASLGGIGFGKDLVSPGFDAFAADDSRHMAISHHLAHAYSVIPYLEGNDYAILVCDLAGSTTHDGDDYAVPFLELLASLGRSGAIQPVRTECLSIYKWQHGRHLLVEREFVMAHNEPDCFVFSPASLYDNAAQWVFQKPNCYGQLMALASFGVPSDCLSVEDICRVSDERVDWLNGWQSKVCWPPSDFDASAAFAAVVQRTTEEVVLAHARRAKRLTGASRLALAGGLFLNINCNSRLAESGLYEHVAVPSAPGDAGIAVGCAMYGQASLGFDLRAARTLTDRLGPRYSRSIVYRASAAFAPFVDAEPCSTSRVARALQSGCIVARWSGRSEFGPRALGGRSLLASPLFGKNKDRLNAIKGRQHWRPVAPIVLTERFSEYFDGPSPSPFMTFLHRVKPALQSVLPVLWHPDHSTRAQTLDLSTDPDLRELLLEFEELSGYAVLANTSLNGPDGPIVETPEEALRFFIENADIDALVLEDLFITRAPKWAEAKWAPTEIRLGLGTAVGRVVGHNGQEFRLYRASTSIGISEECFYLLTNHAINFIDAKTLVEHARKIASSLADELYALASAGWLEWRHRN